MGYEYDELEYEDEEYYDDFAEFEGDIQVTPISRIATYVTMHPHLSCGGGTLSVSFIIDLLTRFNSTAVFLGLVATAAMGVTGRDMLKDFIPGADQEAVHESANHFADVVLAGQPEHEDQRAIAKIKRLFNLGERELIGTPPPQRRIARNTVSELETRAVERAMILLETGKINDTQFFALLKMIDGGNTAAYDDDSDDDFCDEDDATRTQNTPSNQPVEPTQERNSRARQYRLDAKQIAQFCALYPVYEANKDDALKAVGANSSYRAHANELIEEYKLLDKKRG